MAGLALPVSQYEAIRHETRAIPARKEGQMNSPAQQLRDTRITLPRMSAPPLTPRSGRKLASPAVLGKGANQMLPIDSRLAAILDACEA